MRPRVLGWSVAAVVLAVLFMFVVNPMQGRSEAPALSRTPDGKPDLNGIWQAMNTANWNLQDHNASQGPVFALGASFSVPAGQGVVEGNEIPYQPWALEKRNENAKHWTTLDPEVKCFMAGVPRAIYQPHPFQIVQTPTHILMAHEFADASRVINVNSASEPAVDSWMGWSNGRWEGDTLVIDVRGLNGEAWFDRAGNFQSSNVHIVERITPLTQDALSYEATIEDSTIYTRPWKITMPLYRRLEKNAQLLEYKCVEFAEEIMYGHLKKKSDE